MVYWKAIDGATTQFWLWHLSRLLTQHFKICVLCYLINLCCGISVGDTPGNNEVGYKFLGPFFLEKIKQKQNRQSGNPIPSTNSHKIHGTAWCIYLHEKTHKKVSHSCRCHIYQSHPASSLGDWIETLFLVKVLLRSLFCYVQNQKSTHGKRDVELTFFFVWQRTPDGISQ